MDRLLIATARPAALHRCRITGGTNHGRGADRDVILPNVGSIGGATEVKIAGANLGTTVTFGGVSVQGRFFAGNPAMYLSAPAHAAGAVDVVVTGYGGQLVTLTDAYTYVSPLTFDFNGNWASYGQTDQEGLIVFTIRDNVLLGVSLRSRCDTDVFAASPVTNGEFSLPRRWRRVPGGSSRCPTRPEPSSLGPAIHRVARQSNRRGLIGGTRDASATTLAFEPAESARQRPFAVALGHHRADSRQTAHPSLVDLSFRITITAGNYCASER